jgi:hypothetical protein
MEIIKRKTTIITAAEADKVLSENNPNIKRPKIYLKHLLLNLTIKIILNS